MSLPKNRVGMGVASAPGTGTITLGSPLVGMQSFATAYAADATVDILIVDGNAWEVNRDCTYTNSGTTLTRGTREDSSSGGVLTLSGSAVVYVTHTAARTVAWVTDSGGNPLTLATPAGGISGQVTSITYNADGTVNTYTVDGITFTINYSSGAVNTITGGGVTTTITYTSGQVTAIATA